MRILNWNIRHGGGSRIPRIVRAITDYSCDIVVLTEFRNNAAGAWLRNELEDIGHGFSFAPDSPQQRSNGVLIASKHAFKSSASVAGTLEKANALCAVEIRGLEILGAYLPNGTLKTPYWERLLTITSYVRPRIIVGDFNTGRHYLDENGATLVSAAYMDRIEETGHVDAFRSRHTQTRESSWFSSHGNGFRLDHVFVSKDVDRRIQDVSYDHSVREGSVSDHSAMIIEIEM